MRDRPIPKFYGMGRCRSFGLEGSADADSCRSFKKKESADADPCRSFALEGSADADPCPILADPFIIKESADGSADPSSDPSADPLPIFLVGRIGGCRLF